MVFLGKAPVCLHPLQFALLLFAWVCLCAFRFSEQQVLPGWVKNLNAEGEITPPANSWQGLCAGGALKTGAKQEINCVWALDMGQTLSLMCNCLILKKSSVPHQALPKHAYLCQTQSMDKLTDEVFFP